MNFDEFKTCERLTRMLGEHTMDRCEMSKSLEVSRERRRLNADLAESRQQTIVELTCLINKLQERVKEEKAEREPLHDELAARFDTIEGLKTRISELSRTNHQLQKTNIGLEERNKELTKENAGMRDNINAEQVERGQSFALKMEVMSLVRNIIWAIAGLSLAAMVLH